MFEKRDYYNAVMSQGACNASGVIFELGRMIPKLETLSPEELTKSPILRLYAEQLNFLAANWDGGMPTDKDVLTVIREMVDNMRRICDSEESMRIGTDGRNQHETHKPLAAQFYALMEPVSWTEAHDECQKLGECKDPF